jgi:WD40 repeat protein
MQFFFDIQWAMKRLKSNKSKLVGELFSAKAFSNFRHWHGTRKSASILAQEHVQSFGTRRLLAFSHDGSKLAVMRNIADRGRIIQVFDVQTSKTIVYSDGDQNRYYSFAWSPDDQYLAYAGDGRSIKFLDLRPSGHSGGGRCLLGGQWIDGSLAKEAPSLTHVIGVKNSSGPILSLGFSQKDDRVGYSVVKDGTVKCGIFHLGSTKSKQDVIFDTGYPVKNGNSEFGAPSIVMHSIEFGDNDTVTCSSDQFISVFDLRSRERISFTEKTSQSDSRKVFENASFFQKENDYSSTLDGQIGISLQPKKNKYKVSQFALSPDGHFLAQFTLDEELSKPFMGGISKYTSSSHERVKIWNVDLDKNLKSEINQLPNEQAYLLLLMLKQDLKAKDLKKFPLLHELYKSMKSVAKQIL